MADSKRFSIVMTVYDAANELESNLPAFLGQDYGEGYEVVVIDESSADETADVLKRFKADHANLYTTFLPKPDRKVTRLRLALTLGVKASKHEWIVFSDIGNVPLSEQWLSEIAEAASYPTVLMLGYQRPKKGDMRLQTFTDVDDAGFIIGKTERLRANGHKGRLLRYVRGKYDFIVVRADKGHDALRYFEKSLHGRRLLGRRIHVMFHNLFH